MLARCLNLRIIALRDGGLAAPLPLDSSSSSSSGSGDPCFCSTLLSAGGGFKLGKRSFEQYGGKLAQQPTQNGQGSMSELMFRFSAHPSPGPHVLLQGLQHCNAPGSRWESGFADKRASGRNGACVVLPPQLPAPPFFWGSGGNPKMTGPYSVGVCQLPGGWMPRYRPPYSMGIW
jgi:hypothetical protein